MARNKIIITIDEKNNSSIHSPYTTEATLSILEDCVDYIKSQK